MARDIKHRTDQLAAFLAAVWMVLGMAAIEWPGTESHVVRANTRRLVRMNQQERAIVWQAYNELLALSQAEQDRVRKLNADLMALPPDKRARYRGIMDRYMKWRRSLPLYQQQMLDDAAAKGSEALYATFREVQMRTEAEDRVRGYWFVPDATPGVRKGIPKILAKLTPEEIEELDQASPLDRTEKLLVAAQRAGMDVLTPGGLNARPWLRGPIPPPDPARFQNWLQNLPREQLEELGDLAFMEKARERQLFQLYYRQHPEEYRARMRRETGSEPPNRPFDRPLRNKPPSQDRPAEPRPTGKPSKLGIPPK